MKMRQEGKCNSLAEGEEKLESKQNSEWMVKLFLSGEATKKVGWFGKSPVGRVKNAEAFPVPRWPGGRKGVKRSKMLKHVQSLGGEARTGLQSCTSPPPLPPR